MSSVGIVTFHKAINFGAAMQAYALAVVLKSMGKSVSIIDHKDKWIEMSSHIADPFVLVTRKNVFKSFGLYLSRFKHFNDRQSKNRLFADFWETYLPLSNNLNYDNYVVGSDQVWNLHITGGFNPIYFLGIREAVGKNKISYAASGDYDPAGLLYHYRDKICPLLNYFTNISVRESFLQKKLEQLTRRHISVNVDPTLLLTKDSYKELENRVNEEKYILVYQMNSTDLLVECAEYLSKKTGLRTVYIYGDYVRGNIPGKHITVFGPGDVLGWFENADYVLTTSFHGVAFSVIYEKQFWYVKTGSGIRQISLMNELGLGERIVHNKDTMILDPINYAVVDTHLNRLRSESLQYLKTSLV